MIFIYFCLDMKSAPCSMIVSAKKNLDQLFNLPVMTDINQGRDGGRPPPCPMMSV